MPTGLTHEPPGLVPQQPVEAGRLKRVLSVLNLDPAGKFGSLEEMTLALAKSFRERDSLFLPVFLRPLDSESAAIYANQGLRVEALDLRQFRFATLNRLRQLVRDNRVDVVQWNFYPSLVNPYLWALTVLAPTVEHDFTDHISRAPKRTGDDDRGGLKGLVKGAFLVARYCRGPLYQRFQSGTGAVDGLAKCGEDSLFHQHGPLSAGPRRAASGTGVDG